MAAKYELMPLSTADGRIYDKDSNWLFKASILGGQYAEQFVRACNAHDELLEACEAAMRISELWLIDPEIKLENPSEGQALSEMSLRLEAAIAKAKGD